MDSDIQSLLEALSEFEQTELSIIKLSEPILSHPREPLRQQHPNGTQPRSSDASSAATADGEDSPTPASLQADLMHYKELFTKLRFSYVEQVTKEKFLRAVVGDPPLYVTSSENTALEAQLLSVKEQLNAQKTHVADMVAELERQSRNLSQRYQTIQIQTQQLRSLPNEIEGLNAKISQLKAEQHDRGDDPRMNMPLAPTVELVERLDVEMQALDAELAALEEENERKEQELQRLEDELKPLEAQKLNAIAGANEARRRREQGLRGVGDELEERGRWLRGVDTTLRSLLEV